MRPGTAAMVETLLIIFVKDPAPGRVKTRLCPPLTENEAAEFYAQCLCDIVPFFCARTDMHVALAYTPDAAADYFRTLAPAARRFPQEGRDLGDRQAAALKWGHARGYRRVLMRNSDSPDLPVALVAEAAARLVQGADLVVGPCPDGGYYLVGLNHCQPTLFSGVSWSTPRTLADLSARAAVLGLDLQLLPPWPDVDTWADLVAFVQRGVRPGGPGHGSWKLAARLVQEVAARDNVKNVNKLP